MTTSSIAPRESAAPTTGDRFDLEADVVVVGGGGGGLPAALFSRWHGDDVVLLEKAAELGGTARKAAFWYWVPNNEPLRALGVEDREEDFLRYVARLSAPDRYDPDSPTLGLTPWEHDSFQAIYASASPAAELLREHGALPYRHVAGAVDYWSELPEDRTPAGRVLIHEDANESMSDGGLVSVQSMEAAARRDGVDIRTLHRVQRVVLSGDAVVGVEATTARGETLRVGARKGVIFATGGFTHDPELRRGFLGRPAFGGCAAATNEGDFVRIAPRVGAQLTGMTSAWMCPIPLERAVAGRSDLSGMFSVAGDSMIFVDRRGRRVVNEKLQYNELAQRFFEWDGLRGEFPNMVLIQLWDQRSQDHSASEEFGRLIPPAGADDAHVISGNTLAELAEAIAQRLARYEHETGAVRLDAGFMSALEATIERYNGFAASGVDEDFQRGERPVQLMFNGAVGDGSAGPNPTMHPISAEGPYYAALVVGGTLDTKGGPRTDTEGRVLDDAGRPVPGLFGVGNCVASASGNAYWAGGATLGPIIAFAHRAASAVAAQPSRDLSSATALPVA
jgi:succinate dehydrogenase/fumarate reductase flavoprotein subunit